MTVNEFKAWLEGFEESFYIGYPSADQWEKIKEKIDSIDASVSPLGALQAFSYPPHSDNIGKPFSPSIGYPTEEEIRESTRKLEDNKYTLCESGKLETTTTNGSYTRG